MEEKRKRRDEKERIKARTVAQMRIHMKKEQRTKIKILLNFQCPNITVAPHIRIKLHNYRHSDLKLSTASNYKTFDCACVQGKNISLFFGCADIENY